MSGDSTACLIGQLITYITFSLANHTVAQARPSESVPMNWIDSDSVRYFSRTPERIPVVLKRIVTELNLELVNCELTWTLHTTERTGGRGCKLVKRSIHFFASGSTADPTEEPILYHPIRYCTIQYNTHIWVYCWQGLLHRHQNLKRYLCIIQMSSGHDLIVNKVIKGIWPS